MKQDSHNHSGATQAREPQAKRQKSFDQQGGPGRNPDWQEKERVGPRSRQEFGLFQDQENLASEPDGLAFVQEAAQVDGAHQNLQQSLGGDDPTPWGSPRRPQGGTWGRPS